MALAITVLACPENSAAAAPSRSQPLTDFALAATPEQRQFLKYLVSCALPPEVALYADANGEQFTFSGALGLAPAWVERALTETEQRWVSACMLARANAFGKTLPVSMRTRQPAHAALDTTARERRRYSLPEGGFSAISSPNDRSPTRATATEPRSNRPTRF